MNVLANVKATAEEKEGSMPMKLIPMAIAYDFDGTLAPGNMQEYDFLTALNVRPKQF